MKIVISVLSIVFLTVASLRTDCKPKNHHWKPFYVTGDPPHRVVPIHTKLHYDRNYIGRVHAPYFGWSKLVPGQIFYDHISFPWYTHENHTAERYDSSIEVLCSRDSSSLIWKNVSLRTCTRSRPCADTYHNLWAVTNLMSCCCLVEGGIGSFSGLIHKFYIGRVADRGVFYIGRANMLDIKEWKGPTFHSLKAYEPYAAYDYIEVLAYDCRRNCCRLPQYC